ncbi:roundabout homolog 2-like [Amphibalanus amphitrite]|uniref:roundabout homolog 2-like n=1 Tax=Amphibalanus amphitrite TaxID=1232801 RepID=UPI001C925E91|nr:roundabout homolog 2-like [Amphibalanus amphitrite]
MAGGGRLEAILALCLLGLANGDGAAPRITEQPNSELVVRGQPVTLHCKAEGEPTPIVSWFKDGRPLVPGEGPERFFLHGNTLYFVEVRKEDDAGVYWCVAANRHGEARSRNATLQIAALREEFRVSPQDVQVAQTETARLRCDPPRGHPPPEVTWLRNGEPLDVTGSRRLRVDGTDLVVTDARHHDEGAYTCVARNRAGERRSRPARLTVHVKPFFLRPPEDITTAVSQRAELTCQVSGDPQPQIVWKRVGAELPVGRVLVTDEKSLRIDDIRLGDEGEYFCRAENAVGSVTGSARLSVTAPPKITTRATIAESDISEPVALDCRAEGRPTPIVYWLKEGRPEPLAPGGRHTLGTNGSLVLSRPRPGDQGYYVCGAVSTAGSDLLRMELLLRSQPVAQLPAPQQQARQLLDRRPVALLTARAESPSGALLVWSSEPGLSPVDGFYVRYRPVTGGPFATVTVPDPAATSHHLSALRSHTEYQAIVSPYYRGVEGRAAPLVTFTTLQDAPSAPPQSLKARVVNDTSVLLHWQPPPKEHRNGLLTGFVLRLLSNATQLRRNFTLNATTLDLRLTYLEPHTDYWVQVAAVTAPGTGPDTEPLAFTTGGPPPPAAGDSGRVLDQAWFIALLGFLVFVVAALVIGLVYVKRQQTLKQGLSPPRGKQSQEAMWVDRNWRPADSDKDSSLSEQKLLGYQQHHVGGGPPGQTAALCAEYAELDQLRDNGPYASACVIRQNPLNRMYSLPGGYAGAQSLPGGSGSSASGSSGSRGFPTLPAGAGGGVPHQPCQPRLLDVIPPPPSHPPPDERATYHRAGAARGGYQYRDPCVEYRCSEGESSYDERPPPGVVPCARRAAPPVETDDSDYYGIPAGGGYHGYGLRSAAPVAYPHISSAQPAGGVVEKLA